MLFEKNVPDKTAATIVLHQGAVQIRRELIKNTEITAAICQ